LENKKSISREGAKSVTSTKGVQSPSFTFRSLVTVEQTFNKAGIMQKALNSATTGLRYAYDDLR